MIRQISIVTCFIFMSQLKLIAQIDVELKREIDKWVDTAWEIIDTEKNRCETLATYALELSVKEGYHAGAATCYNILGICARNFGSYHSADSLFSLSLEIRQQLKDSIGTANILNNIGTNKLEAGDLNGALKYTLNAAVKYESIGDLSGIASSYENISNILDDMGEYKNALDYSLRSLDFYQQENDSFKIADSKYNLAERYFNLSELKLATDNCNEALELFKVLTEWEGEAYCYNLLGNIAYEQQFFFQAEEYYSKANSLYEENGDNSNGLTILYLNLAELKNINKKYLDAIDFLKKAKEQISPYKNLDDALYLYSHFSDAYLGLKKFDSAYHYQDLAIDIKDSIFNKKKLNRFAEMQTKYETEKTERELAEQKFQTSVFLSLFILALAIATFSYFYFKQKQKSAATIARQKQKIHQQEVEELLKTQELTAINSMLEGQENERVRIAKDLHDRLGSMLTTAKWSFDGLLESANNKLQEGPLEKASNMLDEAYQEVRKIAHNMVSGVLTKFGLVPALQELGKTISEGGKMDVKIYASGLEDRIDNKLEITIYRIVQELISNILKHAQASETIIQLTRTNGELNIAVEDNGKGFDPEQIKLGMGIKNMEARVQALNGSFFIDSGKGNGTTVMIDIPV